MMQSSTQLLRQLEPAVRPTLAPPTLARQRNSIETQSFDQLLSLASQGGIRSGRQIELAFDPAQPLNASQLERLAAAADDAEAAGALRALMMIDGRAFVLDVASRTLVSELASGNASNIEKIDAAVLVAADESSAHPTLKLPGNGALPPSLLKHLQDPSMVIS